jgi:predicted lipid-binding transport protein (Tim44 family)
VTNVDVGTYVHENHPTTISRETNDNAPTSTDTAAASASDAAAAKKHENQTGALVGGIIGGVVGLMAMAGVGVFIFLRRQKGSKEHDDEMVPMVEPSFHRLNDDVEAHMSAYKAHDAEPHDTEPDAASDHEPEVPDGDSIADTKKTKSEI